MLLIEVNHYRINGRGMRHFFGPLEAKVMEIIWARLEATVRDVQGQLTREQEISFNAVMTVMNRLVEKGHLRKRKKGRTFFYEAMMDRDSFLHHQTRQLSRQLIQEYGDFVVSHMIDALEEVDPNLLAKLEEKIGRRKGED